MVVIISFRPFPLNLIPDILDLIIAKKHPRKGAIWLFCKFEIISNEMGNNGVYLILDYSCWNHSFLFRT